VPEVGASSPESILIMVVLPAPLWPKRTRISFRNSVKDKWSTAVVLSNVLVRLCS
jgi:hypothetical protein